jgi:WD40 repeat protein
MRALFSIFITLVFLSACFSQKNKAYRSFPSESKTIYAMCFTPKGNALAVGDNNAIKFFSTSTTELLGTLNVRNVKMIMAIDISRDSTLLVSGGKDSTIVLTDLIKKNDAQILKYHKGIVTAIKISPDNKYLLSGGTDKKVVLYDIVNHQIKNEYNYFAEDITSVAFSPRGDIFAVAGGDHKICLYNTHSGEEITTLSGHNSWVRGIAISADNTKLFSCGDDSQLIKWNIANRDKIKVEESARQRLNWLTCLDVNEDSKSCVIGSINGMLRIVTVLGDINIRLKAPVTRILFVPNQGIVLKVAAATNGQGVVLIDAQEL